MLSDLPSEPALGSSRVVSSSRNSYTIGELAKEFGLTLRALRFYEDRGLISPRREGATRLYSTRDRARVAMIVRAKALGFTLSEIKETLAAEDRRGTSNGLNLSPTQVRDQIAHLEQQKAEVEAALNELCVLRAQLQEAQLLQRRAS
jgi:DNA-binding transcriptional MerR regulator